MSTPSLPNLEGLLKCIPNHSGQTIKNPLQNGWKTVGKISEEVAEELVRHFCLNVPLKMWVTSESIEKAKSRLGLGLKDRWEEEVAVVTKVFDQKRRAYAIYYGDDGFWMIKWGNF